MDLRFVERAVLWAMRGARGQRLDGDDNSGDDVVLKLDILRILDARQRCILDQ